MSVNNKVYTNAICFGMLMLLLTEMAVASLWSQGAENRGEGLKARDDMECRTDFVNENTRGPTGKLPSGTPMYSVTITNSGPTNCRIADLHLQCESFTSEIPIPPNIFRSVGPNDCLVNDGLPIGIGNVVTFEYAHPQIFSFPVLSLRCVP